MSAIHIIKAIVNPSAAPARVGQHWINTVTKQTFFSVGTSNVGDWVQLGVSGSIIVEDEGSELSAAATKLNFAGAGVTVTEPNPNELLITIPSGGGGGVDPNYINSTPAGTLAGAAGAWVDVSGALITIPAPPSGSEKWEIYGNGVVGFSQGGGVQYPTLYMRIVESVSIDDQTLGVTVDNSISSLLIQGYAPQNINGQLVNNHYQTMHSIARVTVSAARTFKLQVGAGADGGTKPTVRYQPSAGGNDPTNNFAIQGKFYAKRVF
jgi:hypothetical protein